MNFSSHHAGASAPLVALILPACHEEQTIEAVLDELAAKLDPGTEWIVAVGVNGSGPGEDRTAALARAHASAPLVAETTEKGYGHGCQAAVDLVEASGHRPEAFIFFAADGANDPGDLPRLVAAYRGGADLVLGCRTVPFRRNLAVMGGSHVLANRLLGAWCGLLTGRPFDDIGPLRLIERGWFHRLALEEWTFGWTIEAQMRAVFLGAATVEIPVRERPRLAGEQKVSKVSWRRSLFVGCQIVLAGWRTYGRSLRALRAQSKATDTRKSPVRVAESADVK